VGDRVGEAARRSVLVTVVLLLSAGRLPTWANCFLLAAAAAAVWSVWDMAAGGKLLHMAGLKGHHKPVRSLCFTPGALSA
jgi:hypothetical protein